MEGRRTGGAVEHRTYSRARLGLRLQLTRSATRLDARHAGGLQVWTAVNVGFRFSIMNPSDNWDQHWQAYSDAAEHNPAQNYRREWILSLLDIRGSGDGARILDIGSGQGDM